jgi:polar amino acid transport system substrate-binding protein
MNTSREAASRWGAGLLAALSATVMLASSGALAQSKSVKLVSDPYPPYVMDEPNSKGFVTEMAIKILKDAGYQAEYVNVPYKRALAGLDEGAYDGLLAVSPGREGYTYPENGFGTLQTAFFVMKSSAWEYKGKESLSAVTLGVIDGYEFSGGETGGFKLDDYVKANKANSKLVQPNFGTDALERNMKKLADGRISAMVEDSSVFWYTAKKMGMTDKFKTAGTLNQPEKLTIGFNLKNPRARELAKVISDGVQKLKDSGEYKKILDKYGLK